MDSTDVDNVGTVAIAPADAIELAVLLADLVDVDIVVARAKGHVAAVRRELDALNHIAAVAVNGDQLACRRVKDHPPANGGGADDQNGAVRREGGRVATLANVLAPDDKMCHRVPQVDRLVVASGDKLVLRRVDGQSADFFGVALKRQLRGQW